MTAKATLAPDELLERIARALKEDIGPAVSTAYPKTQAFMASVVLKKLAAELRHATSHADSNRRDTEALAGALNQMLADRAVPAPLGEALVELRRDLDTAALHRSVEALYATRVELGEELFETLLARVREVLRARIDRALVVSA